MAAIRIVKIPEGEAPVHIRQAWVGCILPIPTNVAGQRNWYSVGVLSGRNRSLLASLCFPGQQTTGYCVNVLDALQVLEARNPVAAQWWRQNTPHLTRPNRMFVFEASACEEVPFAW